jgi:hypothetical protein
VSGKMSRWHDPKIIRVPKNVPWKSASYGFSLRDEVFGSILLFAIMFKTYIQCLYLSSVPSES